MTELFTWEDFGLAAEDLVSQIEQSPEKDKISFIYGVPTGGTILAATLSRRLGIRLRIDRPNPTLRGLIVDDVRDTGSTLQQFCEPNYRPLMATIHVTFPALWTPDFYYRLKRPETWIVYPWEIS